MGKKRGKLNEISTEEFEKMIAEIVPVLYEELMARGQEKGETNKVVSETKMEVEGEGGAVGVGESVIGKGDGGQEIANTQSFQKIAKW